MISSSEVFLPIAGGTSGLVISSIIVSYTGVLPTSDTANIIFFCGIMAWLIIGAVIWHFLGKKEEAEFNKALSKL